MTAGSPPERTCLGCRARGPKTDLVRVVRRPSGEVAVDPTGKAAGRGAYVHPVEDCVRAAGSRGALARALRTQLGRAETARLVEEVFEVAGAKR